MWFRHASESPFDVSEGARFSRSFSPDVIETANIISVRPDPLGIPHVQFMMRILGSRQPLEEQRTLSLESFRSRYAALADAR